MKSFILLAFIFISKIGFCQLISNEAPKNFKKPLNIILLIGDGMGVSQLSSVYYFKEGKINLNNFQHIGLIETSSASHLITDSAAGATAYATGHKTYSGGIGMLPDSTKVVNITEILAAKGYKNGLISTSSITHATPAAFYAHVTNRGMEEAIAKQLPNANIDFFAGGGSLFFKNRKDEINLLEKLEQNNFEIDTTMLHKQLFYPHKKYGFLLANKGMPSILNGRGDFLEKATTNALDYLSKNTKGFFLMIEASQIDWGGHDNNAQYLIEEMKDFDNAIGKVLAFAKQNNNTLVLVTADHETGGFTLSSNNGDYNNIAPTFSTKSHSASLVPILAYGIGSENFIGIYQNQLLFHKILNTIEVYNNK